MIRLHSLLTEKPTRSQTQILLGVSLLLALVYSLPALQEAFSGPYVIQDDARQHVFWMRRFLDPGLFPNDLMADYFQSVAPWGYATLYRLLALLGIDPVTLSKLLPPILGLIVTGYCFGLAMQLLPLPIAGFAAATLLNHNLWMRDDLSSATPGAFFYPIFAAFLYYLLRQSLLPCLITIALQGLFYPQGIFLSSGLLLLQLVGFRRQESGSRVFWQRDRLRFSAIGLGVAALVIGLYSLKSSQFGEVIQLAEARSLPAFSPSGWSAYFSDQFIEFWICGKRSGMVPTEWCDLAKDQQEHLRPWLLLLRFPAIGLAFLLPGLWGWRHRLPLAQQLRPQTMILGQGLVVSIGMFLIAHVLAFRLHLPNRYTEHSLRIFCALAAGLSLVILWDGLMRWVQRQTRSSLPPVMVSAGLAAVLVLYPYGIEIDHEPFPVTGYFTGETPALYEFFAKQPPDVVIASLTEEANQLPTFSQRSLLAGGEGYLLPYHPQYFQQLSQRLLDLLQAQYSPDLNVVKAVIQRYGIDFWLLDRESFQPDFQNPKSYLTSLFEQFPEAQPLQTQIVAGMVPALSQIQACNAFQRDGFRVLRARCILRQ